jgi:hypothetical protein
MTEKNLADNKKLPEEIIGFSQETIDRLRVDFENYLKNNAKNIKLEDLIKRKATTGEYTSLYTRYAWASWLYCYECYWKD